MRYVIFFFVVLLALVTGRTGVKPTSTVPSRWQMWQTKSSEPVKTAKSAKSKETTAVVQKPGIFKRISNLLIVDVENLPDRWMALS